MPKSLSKKSNVFYAGPRVERWPSVARKATAVEFLEAELRAAKEREKRECILWSSEHDDKLRWLRGLLRKARKAPAAGAK